MGIKYGLKLFSTNLEYMDAAAAVVEKGKCSYIELFAYPGTLGNIAEWKSLNTPFIVHAPHSSYGLNFSDSARKEQNLRLSREAFKYADELNAEYIIFHPGVGGDFDETIRQLSEINDNRILIENKPLYNLDGCTCTGASFEELRKILNESGRGFCLDIGHAVCAANSFNIDSIKYLKSFLSLNPVIFHISDNDPYSEKDGHLNIGNGGFDFNSFKFLFNEGNMLTIETEKKYKDSLDDYIADRDALYSVFG